MVLISDNVSQSYRKTFLGVVLCVVLLMVFLMYLQQAPRFSFQQLYKAEEDLKYLGYLINTPTCKILENNPLDSETKSLFEPRDYVSCSNKPLLTYIDEDQSSVTLKVNQSAKSSYSLWDINCCFATIRRVHSDSQPDDTIKFSECIPFGASTKVAEPLIYASCRNVFSLKVYENVHVVISPKFLPEASSKPKLNPETTFSVLLVGIDSISKTHLQRAMPKTFDFLEGNRNFVNLRGFVKIAENTLPNVMGMLAGITLKQLKQCPYVDHIDKCYNIWKTFREKGYITAYGEDEPIIGTFNYDKKGFHEPPTDLYFRPYMKAAEKLPTLKRYKCNYCAGPVTEAERIMKLVADFQLAFKTNPKFGFFFMNTFSHNDFGMPAAMDAKIVEFLEEITSSLDDTIFFFFSDHGIRSGEIVKTQAGWLEERTPFSYLYFPESFKKRFRKEYNNVVTNSKRLTNFYDMYMTLQEVLLFADESYEVTKSRACPLCHSLFREISEERTCRDAAIDKKWCVCQTRSAVNLTEAAITSAAIKLVQHVNKLVENNLEGHQCHFFNLSRIISVLNVESGRMVFRLETSPKAVFEGELTQKTGDDMQVWGDLRRLDYYQKDSHCVHDPWFKRYCYCKPVINERFFV